ncbi:MAG TPA: STELLO glycosyltransferase family protein [Aliidongia sp.]|nr:STELLO glycosyltransferase family protein [Aliidongia sp.]
MRALAAGSAPDRRPVIIIGDTKSPADFELPGVRFVSIEEQLSSGLAVAELCPTRHYARKNIGYLLAIRGGAEIIQETDDDNLPEPDFFAPAASSNAAPLLSGQGWTNVYRYFSDAMIWPRGLPLEAMHDPLPDFDSLPRLETTSPIQQGLADGNPDVDAIFRLVSPMDIRFRRDRRVALGRGSWCPFNSQNTIWFAAAFPLLYLPAYCSFRMTDIWRSFIAQRIAWENGWTILFHRPTVQQERNPHVLMKDFADEIPGYLNNTRIASALDGLTLLPGPEAIPENLIRCYRALIDLGLMEHAELPLLRAWLEDLDRIGAQPQRKFRTSAESSSEVPDLVSPGMRVA